MRLALFALLTLNAEPTVLKLWPASSEPNKEFTEKGADGENRVKDVSDPSITVHLPDKPNGTAVIICPGGGYVHLAIDKEGHDVAKFLNAQGVAGIVLKYRTLPSGLSNEELRKLRDQIHKPLDDLRQALRLTRQNAAKWNIDPARIGVLGFSAGGHLILNAAVNPVEDLRPAFFVPIYGMVPEGGKLPAGTAPMLIIHAHDDPSVPVARAIALQQQLIERKIPFEAHIYKQGGHGFGIRKKGLAVDEWPNRLKDWLAK